MARKPPAEDAVERSRTHQDRSRNELQKSVLLHEVTRLRSVEQEELLKKSAGLRKKGASLREDSRRLRKRSS